MTVQASADSHRSAGRRLGRSDFWCLIGAFYATGIVFQFIAGIPAQSFEAWMGLLIIDAVVLSYLSIPLAVMRLRDSGASMSWLFVLMLPLMGTVMMFEPLARKSVADGTEPDRHTRSGGRTVPDSVIGEIERLDALRKSHAIEDWEFDLLKAKSLHLI